MSIFNSLDQIQPEIEDAPIGANFSTIEYTYDSFLQKIEDGSISDNKIKSNILYSYNIYLDYDNFKDPKTRKVFQRLWTNERFLKNFLEILKSDKNLVDSLKSYKITTINTIAYDYYAANESREKDSEVLKLILEIAKTVNMKYIIPLCTIMNTEAASFMTMSVYSTFDQESKVMKLNDCITRLGYEFSVSNIIYIYSRFYNENFSSLFNYTMLSVVKEKEMSALEKKNNDNISLAIINILNSMTSDEIYKVLKQYGSYITLMNKGTSVRFSLKYLSADFSRISEVVERLNGEYLIIP